ncbi:gamma-glutamyltransferase [Guyparkeria hydrothermalis]|uniref:gamma-glutamyltransferase n=1 Tax=Guyparkeria TaxID=2035712 RepID=UPI0010ABACB6|nr:MULTISPECIES: gamma-glutamyltransferase [Guyparkeria]MCL7751157.1 gamma-glutamyltransferase [Guyparkeria hydrothermalis]TKA88483.1 gamma-glutamyltransferase [Guyparkeria sp. SB14A]
MNALRRLAIVLVLLPWGLVQASATSPGQAAVATAHPMATAAGREVLEAGGNAFDAAVAITAALAVVEPYSSGLGGGGFYLLHDAASGRDVMLDARERAPGQATRDMYLDDEGNPQPDRSVDGALAAGIPGIPAALDHLAADYGALPLTTTLDPAIRAAREGFEVTEMYRRLAGFREEVLAADPGSRSIFLDGGKLPEIGHVIRQPDLAETLERIAIEGRDGFYQGELAGRLVDGVRKAGGIWCRSDLAGYRVVEREPVISRFRGFEVVSAAPPSSGGVAIAQMLNTYDALARRAGELDDLSVLGLHYRVEAMRRAYRDRAEYLGDPDYVDMPIERLTSDDYAAGLAVGISPTDATPSSSLAPVVTEPEGPHTTHFSVMDADGNYVAATLSINYPFGAGVTVPGTGVLLNDEMDDFSQKPGVPNVYGLVGAEANAVQPGKRPLSSMSPTFVRSDDLVGVLGTPGGSRIITMVLGGVLAATRGEPLDDWVTGPRIHHQYLPDRIEVEPGLLSDEQRAELELMGHRIEVNDGFGNMQAVAWWRDDGRLEAASDPRGEGRAAVFAPEAP